MATKKTTPPARRSTPPARTAPPARRSAPPARNENRERNPNNIGALWLKHGNNGTFMSGELEINGEKIRILVFKNDYKEQDNHPDYRIVLPREESRRDSRNDITDDDIPF